MQAPRFTSLIPAGDPVTAEELVAGLELHHGDGVGRPYTIANFVATADGRATFDGRSGALSDPADRALFHALRGRTDAILAGTVTIATERYGRPISDPARRAQRVAAKRTAEPLVVVVSRRGDFPFEVPLFAEPEVHAILFAPARPSPPEIAAEVSYEPLQGGTRPALAEAMAVLHGTYGVDLLLCEGGPTLFGALVGDGLLDELFLTISPHLAGGDSGPPISAGRPLAELAPLELAGALQHGDTLYLRYAVKT
jgi:riboflavin biosynthesis pyrimidine reductase